MNHNAQFAEFSPNSHKPHRTQRVRKLQSKVSPEKSQHAAWGAFQAGMHVLQHYGGRSPANPETIAKANLRLLHRSLLKDPSYTQSLSNASNNMESGHLPSLHCIFSSNNLRADLITLQSGTSIQLRPRQDSCVIYLSIAGKPLIQSVNDKVPKREHWWDRYRQPNHGRSLRNGDAVLVSNQRKDNELLTAEKKECVLLRVQLQNIHDS